MCLFNILIVSSWLFSNKQQTQRNSENQVGVTLLKEIFIFVREISNCKGVSLSVPGREDEQIFQKLLGVEKARA